jgi:hypothetical protein
MTFDNHLFIMPKEALMFIRDQFRIIFRFVFTIRYRKLPVCFVFVLCLFFCVLLEDKNILICLSDETNTGKNTIHPIVIFSENRMSGKNEKQEVQSDPLLIYNNQYCVKCCLAQLNEVQNVLPQNRDVMDGTSSSNYGFVRPLLREIYLQGQFALPELIDYFDSESYLYSVTGHGNTAPHTVAEVTLGIEARRLFDCIINPTNRNYKWRFDKDGELRLRPSFFYSKNIKEWYQKNRDKSLLEIQREVVDYYIQHETKIGFPDKKSEQEYLVPLLELRRKLPIIKSDFFNDPPMPISSKNKTELKQSPKPPLNYPTPAIPFER